MCTCSSCKYTDSFSAKGFAAWPRGEPAGPGASAAAYRAHWNHCSALSAYVPPDKRFPVRYPPLPPYMGGKYGPVHAVAPITPAPKYVRDWINSRTTVEVWGELRPGTIQHKKAA